MKVTINGSGFAGDFTARAYGMIPHKNGVQIELAGICSGHLENARKFAERHGVTQAYETHASMVAAVRPDIDNVACANFAHGQYVAEAAGAGVKVIVVEKPPVIWPGYAEGREADAETRKRESMAYLAAVLDAVRKSGSKLLYAENFIYLDGMKGVVELLREAVKAGKGRVIYQWGVCAHQGSHAPAYDTPSRSGGGALFNKACHPLGSVLYLKQIEGILRSGRPIRPLKVSAVALQVLKHQPKEAGEHFRVLQNVDDFGRMTVLFEDQTVAEVIGSDLHISGIWNEVAITTDFSQYNIRVNPNDANQLFLPSEAPAGNILLREKLPTAQGTSFPAPNQSYLHGYVNELNDAVDCALQPDRHPQSGPLMAWDSMAVLMAAYESSEKGAAFIDVSEYTRGRAFEPRECPSPDQVAGVFLRK
jgi:predicted dehydrogenase